MPAPVRNGHITQEYGVPGDYAAGYHTGRDWAGGTGDIVATRAGRVTRVAYDGDYGNRVEILTGDIEHSYSHMASTAVTVGRDVSQGQYLGRMGSTGNSTGPHCHYEERHSPYGYSDDRKPEFDVTGGSAPQPQPAQMEEVEAMLLQSSDTLKGVLITGGKAIWVSSGADYSAMKAGGVPAAIVSPALFGDVIAAMGGAV